jgi:hypothetical protein
MKKRLTIILAFIICTVNFNVIKAQSTIKRTSLFEIGIADSLHSNTLNEQRNFWVQLPENYNPNNSKKYPVAYILDGGVHLGTVQTVQNYYSGGFIPEMILIGISNRTNRTRDLTTSKVNKFNSSELDENTGSAEKFTQFIEHELIPYIDSKYATTSYRTLIGHSYGGLFTINTLINHPYLFENYLAIDPSLDWDNQKLLNEAKIKLQNENYSSKSLFISLSGHLHMQNNTITIDNVMQDTSEFTLFARSNISFSNIVRQNAKNGLFFEWKFYPKDIHGTIALPSIMDGLISIFEWYQMENTDKINSFDTPKEELLSIIKYRAKKLKSHFGCSTPPYPEELLNMSGYMNMDMQQPEKAKMYFEQAIEYYPNSPNAHDSMADYYEYQNDYINALKYVTKAFELEENDYYKKRMETFKAKN